MINFGEGKIIPAHFIFPLYIDILVDAIPTKFREVFHFQPADEPLLRFVFEGKKHREELREFNKKLWLPKPELLLATKFNALKHRDKEHKKIKDICDIFALLWYSEEKPEVLKEKVKIFIGHQSLLKSIKSIEENDYQKAANQLNHSPIEIRRVVEILL